MFLGKAVTSTGPRAEGSGLGVLRGCVAATESEEETRSEREKAVRS